MFGDTSENYIETRDNSCVIMLKSQLNPVGHSVRTRYVRDIFTDWRGARAFSTTAPVRNITLWTLTHGHINVGRLADIYMHLLCVDITYSQEDLPRKIADRDGWWERGKRTCTSCTKWLWWRFCSDLPLGLETRPRNPLFEIMVYTVDET